MAIKDYQTWEGLKEKLLPVDLNDPKGAVYQTEDDYKGLFYKFVPSRSEILSGKGELFALKIPGIEKYIEQKWLNIRW
jgi:hypothetical protein